MYDSPLSFSDVEAGGCKKISVVTKCSTDPLSEASLNKMCQDASLEVG